MKPILQILSP
ncbi:hypothetical protein F383_18871 [Gossypium arboreum]|uniref:Uncharacterized protein n=1 Tax=Gossypium arboreum TaxID=29729 RepID=A0A0B0NQP1_GOSAR|nr:hypothetical protein F383_18871 [Gossypium arboreum]